MVGTVPGRTFTPRKVCVCVSCSSAVQWFRLGSCQLLCFNVVPLEERSVSENNENTELSLARALALRFITSGVRQVKANLIK